jgi:hypothetical protein
LTDQQAALLGAAADTTIRADADGKLIALEEEEREALKQLAVFMAAAADDPSRFPVTGKMAKTIKAKARGVKGPAQPQSLRNKRKVRQAARRAYAIARRKNRASIVAAFNAAQEQAEAEKKAMVEAQSAMIAKLEAEPKFNVTDAHGNVILSGVPESMIAAVEETGDHELTKIIMPGSAEALQAQMERAAT